MIEGMKSYFINIGGQFSAVFLVISPWFDFISQAAQVAGVIGGVVLLFFSIRHKMAETKYLNMKIEDKKHEQIDEPTKEDE